MESKKSCGCDATESKKVNKGISCNVNSCHYHDGSCNCTAECISVGPSSAESSAETLCATFKRREF